MHDWYQRTDGLWVVDDALPWPSAGERAVLERVIGQWGAPAVEPARATGTPWPWLIGFTRTESGGDPNAISHDQKTGKPIAYGLMQVIPATFRHYRPNATLADMLVPAASLDVGARVLADSIRAGHDLPAAASDYNAGFGPHPSSENAWGMRQQCSGDECYTDSIIRGVNYATERMLRTALVGDSIAVGLAPDLAAALRGRPVRLVGRYGEGDARHEGVVGEPIARIAQRIPGVIAADDPDAVIVEQGANDVPGVASPIAMAAAAARDLADAARGGIAVIALAAPPQPAARDDRRFVPAVFNAALAGQVAALSAAGRPVAFVDPALTDADVGPDGVHLNAQGRAKQANALAPILQRLALVPRPVNAPSVEVPWYRRGSAALGGAVLGVAAGLYAWRRWAA